MVAGMNTIRLLRAWIAPVAAALLMAACGGFDNDIPEAYTSNLTGAQQVPAVASTASGTGLVTVDADNSSMLASVVLTGLAATEVHVHQGAIGANGPVVIPLALDPSGVWIARIPLNGPQYDALRSGNFYIDAHTAGNPNGELRGQLLLQLPNSQQSQAIFQFRNQVPLIEQQRQLVEEIYYGDDRPTSGFGIGIGLGF
jgi:hypothetical protein